MSILSRYLTKEIIKFYLMMMTIVISLFIAVDYLEDLEIFLDSGVSLLRALSFVLLKTPFMTILLAPVSLALAVVIVLCLMSKNNEIVIVKSSGISIFTLLKPIIVLGLFFSLLLFVLAEKVVPMTMATANRIESTEIRKKKSVTSDNMNIWIKGNRLITHIEYYHPDSMSIFGITCNYFDKTFTLIKRIDAEEGIFKQGEWHLYDIIEQRLDKKTGEYQVSFHEEKVENLECMPEDLKNVIIKSEEMNFSDLWKYVKKIEEEGYDATIYRVDLYAKTAFPFVCVVLSIAGFGIVFYGNKPKGLPLGIGLCLGIIFLYWVFYSFCLSLGYGKVLMPIVAAWSTNLIFLCVGGLILLNAE